MTKIRIFFFLLISAFIMNCTEGTVDVEEKIEEDQDGFEYLVFGHFFGMCIGNETCVEIFKLTPDKLYEDRKDIHPDYKEFYVGNYEELPNSKFELSKDLIDYFPNDLLNEESNIIGCPDCLDQGGFYVEYKFNETHRYWIIDQYKASNPAYLHELNDQIYEKIQLINQ